MTDVTKNRRKFIGGSEVAAILGLNRYQTPYEVWDSKKNGNNPFTGNQFTEWGTKLEPVIVDNCAKIHGVEITNRNDRYYSDSVRFLGCHPDGIAIINGVKTLIEAKTVGSNAYKHWSNELPLEYYCQVQHNMFVTDCEIALFICFVLDDRYYFEIEVKRDDSFIEKQNEYLIQWWNRYIVGDEVPLKTVEDYEKDTPEKSQKEASEKALEIFEKLVEVKERYNSIKSEKENLESQLKVEIGESTDLMSGLNTLATWRASTSVRMDTKKLKEEQPEIFAKYAKESTCRRFLIKL